jgi:hypothetical protein
MKTCKRTTVTPVLRPHPLRKAIRELIQRPGHSRLLAGGVVTASLIGIASPTLGQTLELSDLDGSNGFVVNGIDARDYSGESVAAAGDINGDGLDDVIIGATSADPYGTYDAGESYIVFGRSTGFPAALDLADLDGSNGLVVNGIGTEDSSGGSVAAAGDVNGDGLDDVIIAAAYADSNGTYNAGESYIVFGRSTGFPAALDLADLDGSNGFVVNGTDVDDRSGGNVASVGDVNGDGLDDVIIVAWRADPNGLDGAGESYIVFGRSTGFPAALNVADLDGSNGFVVNGIDAFDYAGFSVAGAGDINGDGVDDVIIGAIGADPNGTYIAVARAMSFSVVPPNFQHPSIWRTSMAVTALSCTASTNTTKPAGASPELETSTATVWMMSSSGQLAWVRTVTMGPARAMSCSVATPTFQHPSIWRTSMAVPALS